MGTEKVLEMYSGTTWVAFLSLDSVPHLVIVSPDNSSFPPPNLRPTLDHPGLGQVRGFMVRSCSDQCVAVTFGDHLGCRKLALVGLASLIQVSGPGQASAMYDFIKDFEEVREAEAFQKAK